MGTNSEQRYDKRDGQRKKKRKPQPEKEKDAWENENDFFKSERCIRKMRTN